MGSAGMRRKGRHHLRKLPNNVGGPLGDDKYSSVSFSPAGNYERLRAFLQGGSAESKDSQRRVRIMSWGFPVGLAVVVLLAFVFATIERLL